MQTTRMTMAQALVRFLVKQRVERDGDARVTWRIWIDPLDHRRRLVRAADLEMLRQPRPLLAEEVVPSAA